MNALLEWWVTLLPWPFEQPLQTQDIIGISYFQIAIILLGIILIISFKETVLGKIEGDQLFFIILFDAILVLCWPLGLLIFLFYLFINLARELFVPDKVVNLREIFKEVKKIIFLDTEI